MEIWNLVFMQDQVDARLEVVARCREERRHRFLAGAGGDDLAGRDNFFETDLFRPTLEVVERRSASVTAQDPNDDVSLKIVAEHGRATTFLIADGVQPSNEGRGYILRRMLRRAVTHASPARIEGRAGSPDPPGSTVLGDVPGAPGERVLRAAGGGLRGGPVRRHASQGLHLFEARRSRRPTAGSRATTRSSCRTRSGSPCELGPGARRRGGPSVDVERFPSSSRSSGTRRAGPRRSRVGRCRRGPADRVRRLRQLEADAAIVSVLDAEHGSSTSRRKVPAVHVFLDAHLLRGRWRADGRPGTIRTATGMIRVDDTQGPASTPSCTWVWSSRGRSAGQDASPRDPVRREATARAHTSTHVVHWTLKHLFGEHAKQAGSLVAPAGCASTSRTLGRPARRAGGGRARGEPPPSLATRSVRIFETTYR